MTTTMSTAGPATPTGEPTTVLIIDDHQMYADLLSAALSTVPGMLCVGTAGSADEGIALAARLRPAVAVVDISMPGRDGIAATRKLREVSPRTAVAVVSAHREGDWQLRATTAGAAAFIGKDGSLSDMIEVLQKIARNRHRQEPLVRAFAKPRADSTSVGLTQREHQVLVCIGDGLQVKGISKILGISQHTCRGYIKTLYAKLGVGSRLEAVNQARALGLLSDVHGG